MKNLSWVFKAAVFVALFEGIQIARYATLSGGWSSHHLLEAVRAAIWVGGLHLAAWMLLGFLLSWIVRDAYHLFRIVMTVWMTVTVLARWMLLGASGLTGWELLLLIALALWVIPRSWWQRLSRPFRIGLGCTALLLVSVFSLWGRVPDFTYPMGQQGWLYASSAVLAIFLCLSGLRWPRATTGVIVACVLAIALGDLWSRSGTADRPNVLWILIDTTRRDHVHPFGDAADTPAIERLAAEGIRFDDAVTVIPKTPQSVASFFTGSYPVHHGLRALSDDLADLPTNVVTTFQRAGYHTAAFVNNPWINEQHGFGQGFESFFLTSDLEQRYGGSLRYVSWFVLADRLTVKGIETGESEMPEVYVARARSVTDSVSRYLNDVARPPFFLYAHYFQPHWPYLPPAHLEKKYGAPSGEKSLVNHPDRAGITHGQLIFDNPLSAEENEGARHLYQGEIDDTMSEVGRLLDELDRLGLRDDTIVVFTADHGHSLGDHDYYYHHGAFLYESSVRIPLILRWPHKLPEGRVVAQQVRSIDVAPTLLTLTRLRPGGAMDGRSLHELWEGRESTSRTALLESDVKMMQENTRRRYPGVVGKLRAVRDGQLKLILTPGVDGPELELYDVIADPEENRNLAADASYQDRVSALQEQLRSLVPKEERRAFEEARGEAGPLDQAQPVDEHERELLESLGYVNR